MQTPDLSSDVFSLALHLEEPWYVSHSTISLDENRIDIYIDYHPGKPLKCSKCGEESSRIHDVTEKVWRHLNFFQYKCYLHCRMPRIYCSNCGAHIVDVPWSRSGSGFTLMMESFILMLANNMTFKAISEMIHETDKRIFRVIKHYVKKAQEKLDCSLITLIGVDETSSKKGHNYITSFVNMEPKFATSLPNPFLNSRIANLK